MVDLGISNKLVDCKMCAFDTNNITRYSTTMLAAELNRLASEFKNELPGAVVVVPRVVSGEGEKDMLIQLLAYDVR